MSAEAPPGRGCHGPQRLDRAGRSGLVALHDEGSTAACEVMRGWPDELAGLATIWPSQSWRGRSPLRTLTLFALVTTGCAFETPPAAAF